jgi:hypothetical protein
LSIQVPHGDPVASPVHVGGTRVQNKEYAADLFKDDLDKPQTLAIGSGSAQVGLKQHARVVLRARDLNFLEALLSLPVPQAHCRMRMDT